MRLGLVLLPSLYAHMLSLLLPNSLQHLGESTVKCRDETMLEIALRTEKQSERLGGVPSRSVKKFYEIVPKFL